MSKVEKYKLRKPNIMFFLILQLIISIGVVSSSIESVSASVNKANATTKNVHELMGKLYATFAPADKKAICEKIKILGVAAIPTMIEYLKQKVDPFKELNASECLVQIGELAVPLLLQDLISQAKSQSISEDDIGRVAGVIVKIGKEGIPHIKKHLKSGDQTVAGFMEGLMLAIEAK